MDLASTQALMGQVTPMLYAFGVGIIVLETVGMVWWNMPRDRQSRILSMKCGILGFGVEGLVRATLLLSLQTLVYQYRIWDLGFGPVAWMAAFMLNDLMFYVSHRLMHEVRFLWAIHVVHHSPRHYDLTTGIRGSALGVFGNLPFTFWIPILGIHPVLFLVVDKLFKFYGLAYHTEAIGKLGWLDGILVTPSVHRVHHATNPQYVDKNYGGFWVLFDRMFGTYEPEVEQPVYGLVKDWHGYDLVDCQVHELRDLYRDVRGAASWGDSLRFLLKPPGWRPEGAGAEARAS